MEDGGGLGSLIFYIILGILAIAGSFQGKGKKQKTAPKKTVPDRPAVESMRPPAPPAPPPVPRKPQYVPIDTSEGRYEKPMTRTLSNEDSITDTMARAFAREGSFDASVAKAFASEGVSSFKDFQTSDFVHTEISDSEIGDAPEYDYNARPGSDMLDEGFDLKKATIYSILLNRKEYSV